MKHRFQISFAVFLFKFKCCSPLFQVTSEQILKETFPSDISVPYLTDAPLDLAVVQVARSLIDDIPAKDPRWAEIKHQNGMYQSSLPD